MRSFAIPMSSPTDEDVEYIRELLGFDVQCPSSCLFARNKYGALVFAITPLSPLHWSRQREWPWCIRQAELEPHHVCLDVGGGWAVFKYPVARRCKELISLEIDKPSIEKAEVSIRKFGFQNIKQILGDGRKIPFQGNYFDRIFLISVMEHIEHGRDDCLNEIKRVLKPGGLAFVTMDVVVSGSLANNFYVDPKECDRLLEQLDIHGVDEGRASVAVTSEEKVDIIVIMAQYYKPLES